MKLLHVLVAVGAISAGAVMTSQLSCNVRSGNKTQAEEAARTHFQALGFTVKGIQCTDEDTDGDGYVSCTVSVVDKDGSLHTESAECAIDWSMNKGCKATQPKVRMK